VSLFLRHPVILTSCSAIAQEPHNVLFQLKSCQLLHRCTKKITSEKACSRWISIS